MKRCTTALALCAALLSSAFAAEPAKDATPAPKPAIEMGAPFCDNAILQRGMKVPVWGWSKPGTKVTVEFAGQKVTTTVGKAPSIRSGRMARWTVWLKPLKASFEPAEMIVSDDTGKKLVLKNILVGEVWMASGQSNMQMNCAKSSCGSICRSIQPVGEMNVNPIREFRVQGLTSQLHPIERAKGCWKDGDYVTYSAIGIAFAEKLYSELNVPIAILNCSFSETAIEAWVPREGWASAKDEHSKAIHQKCLETDPGTPEHKQAWDAFYKSLEDQIAESEVLIKKGEAALRIGAEVPGNMHGNRDASWLFNGLINPVIPYAIRGAIWNQGYANMNKGLSYYHNLHSLIRGWRIVWDRPELPVYFHQFYTPGRTPRGERPWSKPKIDGTAEMRLGTWMARDIPNAGMASQIDIGGGIHYSNKAVPGRRLALLALKNQYDKKVVAEGPMFKSYKVKGNEVIVEFDGAKGGLVVADTSFNRSREEGATGFADPKVIENGEDQVKIFWLCGEDRVWHPATFEIKGKKVIVKSDAVKKPRGVSYGSGGIGFQPCLYNKALLPMTPFIQYDNKMVTSKWWPDEKLKIAGETIDPNSVGKVYEYRKMPILSVQFRNNAILQADQPVTIWGSARMWGEYQNEDDEGDCKVHFEFGNIKKTIPVTPGMAEWSVTLPPMKADGTTYTLKAGFTVDGELVHERVATNILFGDVWYIAASPRAEGEAPRVRNGQEAPAPDWKDSGQVVRMIQNQAFRQFCPHPSRFSVCISRTPRLKLKNGRYLNNFASYWKPAAGMSAKLGHGIAARTKRPVGIIFMQSKMTRQGRTMVDNTPLAAWIGPAYLKYAPSLMEEYKTVGSQSRDNAYYLANVRRYLDDWKGYWNEYIPQMIATKAVPEGARWGAVWGQYPSLMPDIGDSKATQVYNMNVYPFTPTALKGIIVMAGEGMVKENDGANFGPEMQAFAKCLKEEFAAEDAAFIYSIPSKTLAPKVSRPKKIEGKSIAVEINDWAEVDGLIEKAVGSRD